MRCPTCGAVTGGLLLPPDLAAIRVPNQQRILLGILGKSGDHFTSVPMLVAELYSGTSAPASASQVVMQLIYELRITLKCGRWPYRIETDTQRGGGYRLAHIDQLSPEELEADAVGSFHDAIAAIGQRVKSGEAVPQTGYFARNKYV